MNDTHYQCSMQQMHQFGFWQGFFHIVLSFICHLLLLPFSSCANGVEYGNDTVWMKMSLHIQRHPKIIFPFSCYYCWPSLTATTTSPSACICVMDRSSCSLRFCLPVLITFFPFLFTFFLRFQSIVRFCVGYRSHVPTFFAPSCFR